MSPITTTLAMNTHATQPLPEIWITTPYIDCLAVGRRMQYISYLANTYNGPSDDTPQRTPQRQACHDQAVMGESFTFLPVDLHREIGTHLCTQSLTLQRRAGDQPVARA
jgi:hypothetical protein